MKFHRTIIALGVGLLILGLCLLAAGVSLAQTVTRRAVLTWQAPTTCAGGAALTNCPIRGYSVQRLQGTTWVQIGTTAATALTYTDEDLPLGSFSYRVLATSDAGPSAPSNVVTKVIDVPGAPGSVVVTVTFTVAN